MGMGWDSSGNHSHWLYSFYGKLVAFWKPQYFSMKIIFSIVLYIKQTNVCCVVSERRYGETQAYLDSEVMHWNCLMLLKCRTFHLLWGWCHILMKCFQKTFIKVSVFLWLPFFHSQTVTPFLITHCGNICRGCLSAGRLLQGELGVLAPVCIQNKYAGCVPPGPMLFPKIWKRNNLLNM